MSLCQEQCNLLSVVKLCLGETLIGQLLGALLEASRLQCSESKKSNPGCLPLPQWDQFGTLQMTLIIITMIALVRLMVIILGVGITMCHTRSGARERQLCALSS